MKHQCLNPRIIYLQVIRHQNEYKHLDKIYYDETMTHHLVISKLNLAMTGHHHPSLVSQYH